MLIFSEILSWFPVSIIMAEDMSPLQKRGFCCIFYHREVRRMFPNTVIRLVVMALFTFAFSLGACAAPVLLQETTRYVSSPQPGLVNQITIDDNYIYASLDDGGFEIRSRYTGFQLSKIRVATDGGVTRDSYAVQFAVRDNYAYVANWYGGLTILDISNKFNPVQVGTWHNWSSSLYPGAFAIGLALNGNTCYLSVTGCGLVTLDVTNPAAPVFKNLAPEPFPLDIYNCLYQHKQSNRLILESYRRAEVYDITQPNTPVKKVSMNSYPCTGMGYDPESNLMFLGYGYQSTLMLKIYDMTNPDVPQYLATYGEALPDDLKHKICIMHRQGNYLFVCDSEHELIVLDCSDLNNMQRVAYFPLPDGVRCFTGGFAIDGNSAYVGTFGSGMIKLDLSSLTLQSIAVPEPASVLLILGTAAVFGAHVIRRKRPKTEDR